MGAKLKIQLMLIGGLIGIGLPFLVAGMALQLTGSVLRIEIVKQEVGWSTAPASAPMVRSKSLARSPYYSELIRDPATISDLCHVVNPVRPFRIDYSSDGHRVCSEVEE